MNTPHKARTLVKSETTGPDAFGDYTRTKYYSDGTKQVIFCVEGDTLDGADDYPDYDYPDYDYARDESE